MTTCVARGKAHGRPGILYKVYLISDGLRLAVEDEHPFPADVHVLYLSYQAFVGRLQWNILQAVHELGIADFLCGLAQQVRRKGVVGFPIRYTGDFGRYVITGRISPRKQADWADHTEKAIGRRLAFVFNDTVVCCPTIHARIESGTFQMSSSPDRPMDLPSIYRRLRQEKIDLIEGCFKNWTKDSTLTKEQQDSIIADLDYWDAQAITHGFE